VNAGEIEQYRNLLLRLRAELQELGDTSRETGEPVELDQARVGRLSRMDAMQAQEMALEAARRRKQQLLKIEGALHRIESGEYGYCFICGEEMTTGRLSVDPTNTRCMECIDK